MKIYFKKLSYRIKVINIIILLNFIGTLFAQNFSQTYQAVTLPNNVPTTSIINTDPITIFKNMPTVSMLNAHISTLENALLQIQQIAQPLYDKLAPTNMETLTIGERIREIIGNTKNLINMAMESYKTQVAEWNAAHGITPDTTFEQELAVGLRELGIKTNDLPLGGKGDLVVNKLKTVIEAIKERLISIINLIKARLISIAQKIGLIKETSHSKTKDLKKQTSGEINQSQTSVQYADTFAGKLAKGVNEGLQNAKTSLKSSFSLSNLALTTTVAVGTNLALDFIRGEKPSLSKAVRMVASLEFAGSVVGSALGAAGGQFVGTLVRTFIPGPIGALVGAVVPVMMGSAGSQMGSSLASDIKRGRFDIINAWKKIDKVELVGSSIGSTIGMAVLSPIPIIGPIIGGIVGGVIGGKISKWIENLVKHRNLNNFSIINRGKTFTPPTPVANTPTGITFGEGRGLGIFNGGTVNTGLIPVSDAIKADVSASAAELQQLERKYYEIYLRYNREVQAGNYEQAKKSFEELKIISERYANLKQSIKPYK